MNTHSAQAAEAAQLRDARSVAALFDFGLTVGSNDKFCKPRQLLMIKVSKQPFESTRGGQLASRQTF